MVANQSSFTLDPNKLPSNACFACNQTTHKIYACPVFKSKTPQERYNIVKSNRHCVSCLGLHDLKQCTSQSTCRTCSKRHHTLLHFVQHTPHPSLIHSTSHAVPSPFKPCSSDNISPSNEMSVTMTLQQQTFNPTSNVTVLLGTCLIQLRSPDGNIQVFRALLDSGSMCTLISEHAVNLLQAARHKSDIQLTGINQNVTHNKGQIHTTIETLWGQLIATNHPMLVLDKLTVDLPHMPLSPDLLRHTRSYTLADPTFHVPGRINVVIGAALFPQIFTQDQFSLGSNMPSLFGTHFGFIVMGTAPCAPNSIEPCDSSSTMNVCLHASSNADFHDCIQRFWQQEEPPQLSMKTIEENLCDEHFSTTHTRDGYGRYIVRLPFKKDSSCLGTSHKAAESRLLSMERKFTSNPRFCQLYHDFLEEYISLGHMSKSQDIDLLHPHYFLPHHGILKESSSTTKLRTVFDASCKSSSGISLNDVLFTGRKLQTNVCDLLMHFRRHNVVFCCDIRQMYRQILISPEDRKFQLILWREHSTDPISTFQLNTVTYGVNSSPYLAIRTLHQLAEDEGSNFPDAALALKHHTYVDDIITGADSEEDALKLQSQIILLLNRGGFELRKWVSNSPQLLHTLPDSHLETPTFLEDSQSPHFTVLGLHWSPDKDIFTYNFNVPLHQHPTKRLVLSIIAKIYDPCGFLTPFIMLAKCFMQLMWTKGLSWDSPLTPDLNSQWRIIVDDLSHLKSISIPRSLCLSSSHDIEIHGFCDASESGFAAIVYFRCTLKGQDIHVSPVIAKSRVAPLKRVTLPRLELCAALLLAQLVAHCRNIFPNHVRNDNIHLWCDSTVVLSWLHTPSYKLKTYVANRVSQTQELVPIEAWKHISSENNPADCASRGLRIPQLVSHSMWWSGPEWLQLPSSQWPSSSFTTVPLDSSHELKLTPLTVLITTKLDEFSLLSRFSSWETLLRTVAWILRFCHNCQSTDRQSGHLTVNELRNARLSIFKMVQHVAFSEELSLLNSQSNCTTRIQRLNPFLDKHGLIRVGGRLKNSSLSFDAKHPILLPKHHHIIDLYIDYFHRYHLHAGPQLLQSLLTHQVWILCARNTIRSRIHKCITCFKQRPTNVTPLMGDLPSSRITPAKPFTSTGVDYGGPFTIKMLNFRFVKYTKVYICVFICMATKAVHIEVVTDLTTDAFIAALQRFLSRRGVCTDIFSDCATNFVGANTALRKIIQSTIHDCSAKDVIQRFTSTNGLRFHFNPPAAPHQGGIWESAIKSAKYHLHRVIGNSTLTLPEFITLSIRVEAMLNSRPLTPLSNDPSDLSALTPGHFLVGGPMISLAEPDGTHVPQNRLKHWHLLQKLHQDIWHRWSLEYLHTLQQRNKWNKATPNMKVNDLVLIHSPSSPLNWPLARVIKTHPGKDGIVRVVTVKTIAGILKRPAVKVFPLPLT